MKLSRKTLFAIEAVLDIAFHTGGEPVQSQEITRRQGIPRRYLEQTLQQLVRAGLLSGVRGPRGGYRLARERRRILIGEIVRAVATNKSDDDMLKSEMGRKVIGPTWKELQESMVGQLNSISVDDLCTKAHRAGITSEVMGKIDFAI